MRTCIFCGNPVDSKEDAWPLWLVRRLGNTEKGIVEGQRGKQTPHSWRAGKYPLRTGNVCKVSCNNGWMSDLENRVKPIIERFFLGKQVSLDQHDQTTLAIWICKNAMVYETLRHESSWFFTSQEHKLFRESFHLPLHTSIWIAKSVGFTGLFCTASDLNGIAIEPINHGKAYVTTMGFGPIAIQILNAKMSKPIPQNITITGNLQCYNHRLRRYLPALLNNLNRREQYDQFKTLECGRNRMRRYRPNDASAVPFQYVRQV